MTAGVISRTAAVANCLDTADRPKTASIDEI